MEKTQNYQIFTCRVTEYVCSSMAVLCPFSPYTLSSSQFRSSPPTHLDLSEVFVSALPTSLSSHMKIWPSVETYNSSWEPYRRSYTQQHMTYSRQNNGHPPSPQRYLHPNPQNWLCYDKRTLQMWCRISRWDIILNYLGGPKVITRLLYRRGSRWISVVRDLTMEARGLSAELLDSSW